MNNKINSYPTLAIFGGTFDPVHNGHIAVAQVLVADLGFQQVLFVPCKQQVMKGPSHAAAEQRVEMLQIVLADYPKWQLDQRELQRETPSYTLDTLHSLRQDHPHSALVFVLGVDAFNEFDRWHEWHMLFEVAHTLVIDRPDAELDLSNELMNEVLKRQVDNLCAFGQHQAGNLYFHHTNMPAISATEIRLQLEAGRGDTSHLPKKVFEYIQNHNLYSN